MLYNYNIIFLCLLLMLDLNCNKTDCVAYRGEQKCNLMLLRSLRLMNRLDFLELGCIHPLEAQAQEKALPAMSEGDIGLEAIKGMAAGARENVDLAKLAKIEKSITHLAAKVITGKNTLPL